MVAVDSQHRAVLLAVLHSHAVLSKYFGPDETEFFQKNLLIPGSIHPLWFGRDGKFGSFELKMFMCSSESLEAASNEELLYLRLRECKNSTQP